jgi:hypothetical protein
MGAPNAVIAHAKDGKFDLPALLKRAQDWPGLEGMDLARVVSRTANQEWEGGTWALGKGYARSSWRRSCRAKSRLPARGISTSLDANGSEGPATGGRDGFRREGQHLPQP